MSGAAMQTSTTIPPESTTPPVVEAVPPLENGDRLTRDEFERRYKAMPELKKAELIEGIVYMASPVSYKGHGRPHLKVNTWLGNYLAATPGVDGADHATTRLDLDNEPQPDACLIVLPEHGGRCRIDEDDYIVGGPEIVVEIASSSASYDLHSKLNAYRRNGVLEYVVWRTRDAAIDWFVLRGGRYDRLAPVDGICRSEALPGLWLDVSAMLKNDLAAVLGAVARGTATPEHAAFVAGLAAARSPEGPKP